MAYTNATMKGEEPGLFGDRSDDDELTPPKAVQTGRYGVDNSSHYTKNQGGKGVDEALVNFLWDYTNTNPECSAPMRRYLRDLMCRGHDDPRETMMNLEMGLRSVYMDQIGVGPELRDRLSQYEAGGVLINRLLSRQQEKDSPASSEFSWGSQHEDQSGEDEDQAHWSDLLNQSHGGLPAEAKNVVKLDEQKQSAIPPRMQDTVDTVVGIMKKKLPAILPAAKVPISPPPPPEYGAGLDQPGNDASEESKTRFTRPLPMTYLRSLSHIDWQFDPSTGLVVMKPAPGSDASENEAATFAFTREGIYVDTKAGHIAQGRQTEISWLNSEHGPWGEQGSTELALVPRIKVVPKDPPFGGVFWNHYKECLKSNPKDANILLALLQLRLNITMHEHPEGVKFVEHFRHLLKPPSPADRGLGGLTEPPELSEDSFSMMASTSTNDDPVEASFPAVTSEAAMFTQHSPDWTRDSWYRGKRQPPLAIRLRNVLNFLSDEDVDRCANFKSNYREIGSYLKWLWDGDENKQLRAAEAGTQRLYSEAVIKMLVHQAFENDHYGASEMSSEPPPIVPLPPTRLDWARGNKSLDVKNTEVGKPINNLTAYMRPVFHRPPEVVNSMLEERTEGIRDKAERKGEQDRILEPFARATGSFWRQKPDMPRGDQEEHDRDLAFIESDAFCQFIGRPPAWIVGQKRPPWEERLLPDDTLIIPNDPKSWARERGARRAGMNQLLRGFRNSEQTFVMPARSLVALPIPAEEELWIKAKTNGIQWQPPHLAASQIPSQLETMPYTYWWRIYSQELGWLRYEAMLECQRKYSNERRWITLPMNLIWSGPFVWRQVDPDVQARQDTLRRAEAILGMLNLAARREPRPLLTKVVEYAQRARHGEFSADGRLPPEITLRNDEWYHDGGVRQPRFPADQDFKWLQWLGTDCANLANYGAPSGMYTGAKYRMYRVFSKRVMKLLADRSPDSLFLDHNARVKVEDLLERMNGGANGQVKKMTFKPYRACFFLDRMAQQGLVQFESDLEFYGIVRRPAIELAPEHRVVWPGKRSFAPVQIPRFPQDLMPYSELVQRMVIPDADENRNATNMAKKDGKTLVRCQKKVTAPSVEGGSKLYGFFVNLGLRLGWALFQLAKEEKRWMSPHMLPLGTQVLRDAVGRFDKTATERGRSAKDLVQQTRKRMDMIVKVQDVVQRANALEWHDAMTENEAVQLIRDRIAAEGEANLPLLAPARRHEYFRDGEMRTAYVHDISWDWAGARVRGWRRQFWDMDRWAPHDDYLTRKAKMNRATDAVIDWSQCSKCSDRFAADPTPQQWKRPKLRRFGQDDKTRFKPGPAIYPIGDTKSQREAVEDYVTDLAARAMGINRHKRTWSERFSRINPFSSPPDERAVRRDGDAWLPKVDPKQVPISFDPESFLAKLEHEQDQERGPDVHENEEITEELAGDARPAKRVRFETVR